MAFLLLCGTNTAPQALGSGSQIWDIFTKFRKQHKSGKSAMRITDDRYTRDTERMDLAIRLIRLEARTRTIRRWTGLSDDRIRKLYRSYLREGRTAVRRHRGKSPQRPSVFLGTSRTARHATALASLLAAIGAIPALAPATAATTGANKERSRQPLPGDLVCDAYEAYCALLPTREIGFEHAILLATALNSGRELRLAGCRHCSLPLLADGITLRTPVCERCDHARQAPLPASGAGTLRPPARSAAWSRIAKSPILSLDATSIGAPKSAKSPTGSSVPSPIRPRDS
jgi:hypothetical protein